jgi:hypothetical protein
MKIYPGHEGRLVRPWYHNVNNASMSAINQKTTRNDQKKPTWIGTEFVKQLQKAASKKTLNASCDAVSCASQMYTAGLPRGRAK